MDFDADGPWCHGQISALEASRRLEDVGSFLVREDSNNQFIVTFRDSKLRVCHAQIPSTKKSSIVRHHPYLVTREQVLEFVIRGCSDLFWEIIPNCREKDIKNEIEVVREQGDYYEEEKENFTIHKEDGNNEHKCPYCDLKLKSERRCVSHVDDNHRVRYCPICDQIIFSLQYRSHFEKCARKGEKILRCDQCSYTATDSHNFKSHKKTHDRKKYKCDRCDKKFLREKSLKIHGTLSHKDPLFCEHCGAMFLSKRARALHIKTKHFRADDGSVWSKCCRCDFVHRTYLEVRIHQKLHRKNQIPPQICQNCKRVFKKERYLKTHIKEGVCTEKENIDIVYFV